MPELPEVETTRRSFAHRIQGARIEGVRLGAPLRWPLGCEPQSLLGRRVLDVRRRGKYLLLDLDRGLLLLHLGMSGSLGFGPVDVTPEPGRHDHFDLRTSQGLLRLHDPRRFGAVVHADNEHSGMAQKLLQALGPEPLGPDFTPDLFHAALRARSAPIKQVLLAGRAVVGVGNIYASEALFLAGIRPTTAAQRLSAARVARLHAAIAQVLQQALDHGGSTLRDYTNAHGETGFFQLHVKVYDRAGQACHSCQTPIRHLVQGQRSTYYCPRCQRP